MISAGINQASFIPQVSHTILNNTGQNGLFLEYNFTHRTEIEVRESGRAIVRGNNFKRYCTLNTERYWRGECFIRILDTSMVANGTVMDIIVISPNYDPNPIASITLLQPSGKSHEE